MVTQAIITLMLIGFGILFALGKGAFLIAGYNTMSAEERAKQRLRKRGYSATICLIGLFAGGRKSPAAIAL